MPSQHKHPPVSFRPPEDDRRWLYEHAAETSQSVGAVLSQALAEHRKRVTGSPGETVRGRCLHTEVVPVELTVASEAIPAGSVVAGEVVARLCLTCDTQLPA